MCAKPIWILLSLAVLFSACNRTQNVANTPTQVVNLATWSNYVTPETLAEFEKQTKIHVNISNYSSNEELLAKLQAGVKGYDVVMPSDYMVFAMIQLGLLHPLDLKKIPHSQELSRELLAKSFDPTNQFSLPYDWGTTGIAINRLLYKGEIKTWKALLTEPELSGKVVLLDDVRETLGAALRALGFSSNSKNAREITQAKELLINTKKRIRGFNSDNQDSLASGDTVIAQDYSTDALRARKKSRGVVDYILPEDGCTFWIDTLVIPRGAEHLDEAHALIDFLITAKSNVQMTTEIFVAPSNLKALALLSPELKTDPRIFPPKALLSKCEMIQDLGESLSLWDRAWTEVKTAN